MHRPPGQFLVGRGCGGWVLQKRGTVGKSLRNIYWPSVRFKFVKPSPIHVSCSLANERVPCTDALSCEAVSGHRGSVVLNSGGSQWGLREAPDSEGKKTAVGTLSNCERVKSSQRLGLLRWDFGVKLENGQFCQKRLIPMPALKS